MKHTRTTMSPSINSVTFLYLIVIIILSTLNLTNCDSKNRAHVLTQKTQVCYFAPAYGPEPAVSIENDSPPVDNVKSNRRKRETIEALDFADSSEEIMRKQRAASSYGSPSTRDDYRGYSGRKIYRSYSKNYRQPRRKSSSRRFDSEETFVTKDSQRASSQKTTNPEQSQKSKSEVRRDRSTSIEVHSASSTAAASSTGADTPSSGLAASSATSSSSTTDIKISTDTGKKCDTPLSNEKSLHLDASLDVAAASSLSVNKDVGVNTHTSTSTNVDSGISVNSGKRRYHNRYQYSNECSDEDDFEHARRYGYRGGRRYGTRGRGYSRRPNDCDDDLYEEDECLDDYADSRERYYEYRRRHPHRHGKSGVSLHTDTESSSLTNLNAAGGAGSLSSSTNIHADSEVNLDLHTGRRGRLRRPESYEDLYDPDYYSHERYYDEYRRRHPHSHRHSGVSLHADSATATSSNLNIGRTAGGLSSSTNAHADSEVNVDVGVGRRGGSRRSGSYDDLDYSSEERYYDDYRRRRPNYHKSSGVSLHANSEASSATDVEVGGTSGGLSSSTNAHTSTEVNIHSNSGKRDRQRQPDSCEEVCDPECCSGERYYNDNRRKHPHHQHRKSGVSVHTETEASASSNLDIGGASSGISSSTNTHAGTEINVDIGTDTSARNRYHHHKYPGDCCDDRPNDDVTCEDELNGGAYPAMSTNDNRPYVCDDCRKRLCTSPICPICGKPDFFRLKKKRSVADEIIYHFATGKPSEDEKDEVPESVNSLHYLDLDVNCSGREMYMNPECQDSNINLETDDGNLVSLGYVRAHLNHGHDFAIDMQNRGKTLVMSGIQPEPHTPSMLHFLDNQVDERLMKLNEESELTLFGTKLLQESLANEYKLTPNTFASFLNEHGFHVSGSKICRRQLRECANYEKYRSMDGACNNLRHSTWGQSNTAFGRILPPRFADGIHAMPKSILGSDLPNPRELSVKLFRRGKREDGGLTLAVMQWGQILAHDFGRQVIDQTVNGGIECCMERGEGVLPDVLQHHSCSPITISAQDKFYSAHSQRCMNFVRSMTVPSEDCTLGPAKLLNAATSYLDCSFVYGPDKSTSDELREFRGGRLKIEFRRGNWVLPRSHNKSHLICDAFSPEDFCYASGDIRTNQNPQLVILQTLLVREHNRLADGLATLNPHWNDERLFQEARRILIAEYQHITYNEWLPILLGDEYCKKHGLSPLRNKTTGEYNSRVNPSTTLGFTSGAFRYLHTLIDGDINFYTPNRDIVGTTRLSEHYFRPRMIEEDNNFEYLLRGLTTQPIQGSDTYLHRDITEYLFKSRNNYGMDLMAVDIQRGRDHGLPGYNEYRKICRMRVAKDFDDLAGEISDKNLHRLKRAYAHVDDIDLIVGASMEPRVPDGLLGPTNRCLMAEQFYRTRVGDRYFYDHRTTKNSFTPEQLREIKKVTLSRFMCDMGPAVSTIQPEAFKAISPSNPLINCEKLDKLNLKLWKD